MDQCLPMSGTLEDTPWSPDQPILWRVSNSSYQTEFVKKLQQFGFPIRKVRNLIILWIDPSGLWTVDVQSSVYLQDRNEIWNSNIKCCGLTGLSTVSFQKQDGLQMVGRFILCVAVIRSLGRHVLLGFCKRKEAIKMELPEMLKRQHQSWWPIKASLDHHFVVPQMIMMRLHRTLLVQTGPKNQTQVPWGMWWLNIVCLQQCLIKLYDSNTAKSETGKGKTHFIDMFPHPKKSYRPLATVFL